MPQRIARLAEPPSRLAVFPSGPKTVSVCPTGRRLATCPLRETPHMTEMHQFCRPAHRIWCRRWLHNKRFAALFFALPVQIQLGLAQAQEGAALPRCSTDVPFWPEGFLPQRRGLARAGLCPLPFGIPHTFDRFGFVGVAWAFCRSALCWLGVVVGRVGWGCSLSFSPHATTIATVARHRTVHSYHQHCSLLRSIITASRCAAQQPEGCGMLSRPGPGFRLRCVQSVSVTW